MWNSTTASGVMPVHVLLLHTDDGRTGVGLGPHAGVDVVFPAVQGQDPRAVQALYDRMIQRVFKAGHGGKHLRPPSARWIWRCGTSRRK